MGNRRLMDRSYDESLTKGGRFEGYFGSREGTYFPWIDTMRGICMIAILLYHTEVYYTGKIITPYQCYVHNALAGFFFLSGYLFVGNKGFSISHKLKSILRSLILPYFFFTIILGVLKVVFQHADATIILNKVILGHASWFVAALIVAELLMCITMFITRGKTVFLCLIAVLSFAIVFVFGNKHDPSPHYYQQNLWYFNDAMLALGIIICGTLYRRFESFFNRFHPILYTSSLFFLIIIIKIMIMTRHEDTVIGSVEVSNIPLFLADITVSTLFLVALCKWLGRVFMISWTGEHSLVYYFFCGASPTLVALLLNKIGFPYGSYWQLIIALILVYDLCTIISFIVYRYLPFLTGKRKTAAAALLFIATFAFPAHSVAQEQPSIATLRSLSMPVVVINTIDEEEPTGEYVLAPEGCNGGSIRNATKVPGSIVIYKGNETLYDSGEFEEGVSGMKYKIRGNWSSWLPKKPFKIKLEKKADLLCRGDKRYNDRNWLLLKEEKMLLYLYAGMQINRLTGMSWTPSFEFVNVVINGDFRGIYALCESVRRNADCRLDVDKNTGYILEYDPYWWNEDFYVPSSYSENYTFKHPDIEDFTEESINYISNAVLEMEQSIKDGTYPAFIDVPSFASWLLAHDILGTQDGLGSNIYFTKYDNTQSSLFQMANLWDFDTICMNEDKWATVHNKYHFGDLLNSTNTLFKDTYISRYHELSPTIFNRIDFMLDSLSTSTLADELQLSKQWDCQRWGIQRSSVEEEISSLRQWFTKRKQWMDNNIPATTSITHYQTPNTNQPTPNTYHPTPIFDLSGRRIIPNRPGIYIKDNRKYILPRK